MEASYKNAKLADSTLVIEWLGTRAVLQWHYDQEKMGQATFIEMQPHLFQAGDIIQHCGRAYEITEMCYSQADKGYWVGVKGEKDSIFCSKHSSYKVKRDHVPAVS